MTDNEPEVHQAPALPALTADAENDAQNPAMSFIREHPVLIIAGGIAVGALAAALIPRKSRTALGTRAAALAEVAAAAGIAIGRQALERAGETGAELRRQGARAASRAETFGETALERAGRMGSAAADRAAHLVAPATRAASAAGSKVAEKAADLASRVRR